MLGSGYELLEVVVDMEKFLIAVLQKMEYFHVAEKVVERDYPLGTLPEEGGPALLWVGVHQLWEDNMERESEHLALVQHWEKG